VEDAVRVMVEETVALFAGAIHETRGVLVLVLAALNAPTTIIGRLSLPVYAIDELTFVCIELKI
jgi:hypothetical protein